MNKKAEIKRLWMEARRLAGEILDSKTKIFMSATGEKDYSKAFHEVIGANPEYKKIYLNE